MIKKLLDGYFSFQDKYFNNESNDIYKKLVEKGQKPHTMVIGCADSRVDPANIFNSAPGELFVIRNVANLVPAYSNKNSLDNSVSSALDFAVNKLFIKNIIILGHSFCGGINELISSNKENNRNIKNMSWIDIAQPALQEMKKNKLKNFSNSDIEKLSLKNSLINLKSYPFISNKLQNNNLRIFSWWLNIKDGVLWEFDEDQDEFIAVKKNGFL